jgi:hypothetical protein
MLSLLSDTPRHINLGEELYNIAKEELKKTEYNIKFERQSSELLN